MPTNPYTGSYVGSFFAEMTPEEKAMLNPMYQNIGQQQAFETQQMQQGNALTQAAGQTAKDSGGMNALALAALLRKKEEKPTYVGPSYGTNPNFSNSHFDTMSYD